MSKSNATFPYTLPPEGTKISTSTPELLRLGYKFLEVDSETNEINFISDIGDMSLIVGEVTQYLRNAENNELLVIISISRQLMTILLVPDYITNAVEFED